MMGFILLVAAINAGMATVYTRSFQGNICDLEKVGVVSTDFPGLWGGLQPAPRCLLN